jgi:hypothetical protein
MGADVCADFGSNFGSAFGGAFGDIEGLLADAIGARRGGAAEIAVRGLADCATALDLVDPIARRDDLSVVGDVLATTRCDSATAASAELNADRSSKSRSAVAEVAAVSSV